MDGLGLFIHTRNRHGGRYDFERLVKDSPALAPFVRVTPRGESSIDFADPEAVLALNRALLKSCYGVMSWSIPAGYLCPPIPGRADYVHHVADLLDGARDEKVRVLDVGVGANCIYPIIGRVEYGWRFVGSDVDPVALESAQKTIDANPNLKGGVELRLQTSSGRILAGVVRHDEYFDAVMCNPPFHASLAEAEEASRRKWTNLNRGAASKRNFGGNDGELWYPGGEAAFVGRMIQESTAFRTNVGWFTTLISKESNLPVIAKLIKKAGASARRQIHMAQGQKKSRIVAWTFAEKFGAKTGKSAPKGS
ncbi:MAG: 23S rRNA (adenine(1618)-N(6))-methyltransferase RlmF [Elusimicrobiota bacterium]